MTWQSRTPNRHSEPLGDESHVSSSKSFRGRSPKNLIQGTNQGLQEIFRLAQDDIFRHSVLRYGICQCWLFYNWGLCNPKPRTKYSFFFIAKKKERTLDKKEKQRRLKTVTKFNFKLVNSLSLRQHEFFHCFIK